ncbi:iron ABC transporter ATP-binding protein [Candidatus Roizmanbacteria bacterium CG10_big_fil_rev_8_21_14_0_10_45_7]|uniref:Iron ABC transporter ATP-binding protein n=1 Tax=Candidatus Roizmanbacteria bacterium CG10_big_fil_rev_8_21_14_0_10_45_7 TaxID=1974854 RepID=A0A2M8KV31_9BACT|nr:MAG: iron ABC transporter ATP-binding protein [Candidatus Roizmanbacteria bacterium CG10_big_fil_rev_8_21_14_0_10_45_7]
MKNIARIVKISKPLHPLFLLIAVFILIQAILELVVPFMSKLIVDEIVAQTQGIGGPITTIAWLIAGMFGLSMLSIIFEAIVGRLGDHNAAQMRAFLTARFYRHVLSLPQSYFDSEISGKIVNQLNRGITTTHQFINTATNFILPTIVQTIFTIAFMMYYSVWIGLLSLSIFPIFIYLSYISTKQWGKYEEEKNKLEDYTRGRITEVLTNMKIVKSTTNEQAELHTVNNKLTEINTIYAKQSNTFYIWDFLRNGSLIIILSVVNIIVFYNAYRGLFTIGEMVLILQLINQLRRPLFAMSYILSEIQRAESGSKEFFEILEYQATEPLLTHTLQDVPQIKQPTITFDKVSFNYQDSESILRDISFTLPPQQTVALVGHSGAGKSTIVNMILRFYEPTSGTILLNDKPYQEYDHRTIRRNIALVMQDNELFSTTIRENVAYGRAGSGDTDIIRALKLANAYNFVKKLPKVLDAQIGERGVRLSGGQKQRIQIARAILADAPILILDEATSNLDSASEHAVQEGLINLMKNRLVIVIAHRFSTIQHADRILVIDEGTIVDEGTPVNLAKKPGIYSNLLKYQVEGNKQLLTQFDLH